MVNRQVERDILGKLVEREGQREEWVGKSVVAAGTRATAAELDFTLRDMLDRDLVKLQEFEEISRSGRERDWYRLTAAEGG